VINATGPWGTGPYKLVEGFSQPDKRSDRLVLEANLDYWNPARFPRLQRIVFDNTLAYKDALELVKTGEGQVDIVTGLHPLETLRVAQSPFATVVKHRGALRTMFGMFNMQKTDSPWRDVRLRQAVNVAINREDLIQYAAKGNGVVVPALIPHQGFGFDPDLTPYPFAPDTARQLLREAGYAPGLLVRMIASEDLTIQATVVSKMLELAGFTVEVQILDAVAFNRQTMLSLLDQPPDQQTWDVALTSDLDFGNFPAFALYHYYALEGPYDWVVEDPEFRQLYGQLLGTVDRSAQQAVSRQMERHARDQAYFLFLYNPFQLYAVNKAVQFVPYATTHLVFAETSVTEQHWSVRKQKAAVQE
jgi:peptide/nickel transport system substrate-binding protein